MKQYLTRFDSLDIEIVRPNPEITLFRLYTGKPSHHGFAESKHSTISMRTTGCAQGAGYTIPISANAFAVIVPDSDHWGEGKIVIELDQAVSEERHFCPVCGYSGIFGIVMQETGTIRPDGTLLSKPTKAEVNRSTLTTCPCGFSGEKWEFQTGNWGQANPEEWASATLQKCLHYILVFLEERPDHNNIIGHVFIEAQAADEAILEAEKIIMSEPRKSVTFGLHSLSKENSIKTWEF